MSRWMLLAPAVLVLTACQTRGPDPAHSREVAQFYLDQGGSALHTERRLQRPCLQGVNLKSTLLGGFFIGPTTLVNFIEKTKIAEVTRTRRPSGYIGVTMTPLPPYEEGWETNRGLSYFCFGKFTVVKAEPVADAEPLTAGSEQPYLVPGTKAYSTRVTFKLDDVPGGAFIENLRETPNVLTRGSMLPEDYGRELTLVAVLPEKTDHFNLKE